jgi:hypothetical protein
VEITPQWEERHVVLDRKSVLASTRDGTNVELAYLVPVEFGNSKLRMLPYPDRTRPDGEYSQVTVIPGLNTCKDRNVNVFGTNDGQTYFVVELADDKAAVRFGLVFAVDHAMLKTLYLLGTEVPAVSDAR